MSASGRCVCFSKSLPTKQLQYDMRARQKIFVVLNLHSTDQAMWNGIKSSVMLQGVTGL